MDQKISLKPKQKEKLVAHILNCWDAASAARNKWLEDKQEGLQLYWGIRRPKDFPFKNCSNLHIPLIRTVADTLHASVMGSIDPENPCSAIPVGPEDIPKARKIEKLLNWQFTTQIDYPDFVDKIAQSEFMMGISISKVWYDISSDRLRA